MWIFLITVRSKVLNLPINGIDLGTLENIADETVKDAVKAAQFKRELLQASIALGAGVDLEDQKNQKE